MKLKMSENLKIQVVGQENYSGKNHPFVLNVKKMLSKEFKNMNDAENFANEIGLGRTILYGNLGLVRA